MLLTYVSGLDLLPEITSVELHHEWMWPSSFYNYILKSVEVGKNGALYQSSLKNSAFDVSLIEKRLWFL